MSMPFPVISKVSSKQPQQRRHQRGVSLIEVLVSVLVISMGLLSMAGLLGTAARYSKTSESKAIATLLIADIVDRMEANRGGMASYEYKPDALATSAPDAAAECETPTKCTNAELAAIDLAEWQATLFNTLTGGTGYVTVSDADNRLLDVWVLWSDPSAVSGVEYMNAGTTGYTCPPEFKDFNPLPRCVFLRVGL